MYIHTPSDPASFLPDIPRSEQIALCIKDQLIGL